MCVCRDNKLGDDTTSRDSDSLIQEFANAPTTGLYTCCCQHPKVRENWRTVLAAVTLLVIGVVLAVMGVLSVANPQNGSRGIVFLLAGKFLIFGNCFLIRSCYNGFISFILANYSERAISTIN